MVRQVLRTGALRSIDHLITILQKVVSNGLIVRIVGVPAQVDHVGGRLSARVANTARLDVTIEFGTAILRTSKGSSVKTSQRAD